MQSLLRGASVQDSATVSFSDLRIVNAKLTELNYIKIENKILKNIHSTDSLLLKYKDNEIDYYQTLYNIKNEQYNKSKLQRNIAIGTTGVSIVGLILMLLLK